jgi:2-oxo-4-hydroxy-4-carboxy-5-ureidoimidazoline decarboxylase
MTRETFVQKYGGIYEHSAWVAEAVYPSDDLTAAMRQAVEDGGHDRQLALLRAHPDLGEKLDTLTPDSTAEQQGAGLNLCSPEEFREFHELNRAYREKFGFPFIVAVKGLNRQDILERFRQRIHNSSEQEFRTALDQVHRIAAFRLADLQ